MTTTEQATDHELAQAIIDELSRTPSVTADHVGVSINCGAVTLSGQVQTYPERIAAVRAALRVRGVRAVADEILVRNDWAPRQDADIARDASAALSQSLFDPLDSVRAAVHDKVVVLTGDVTWDYQRMGLERVIAGLRGVHGLRNDITLTPVDAISPTLAREKITAALRRSAELNAQRIQIDVVGTTVTLAGSVASSAEQLQASTAAWATPGVTHVENNIRVEN